MAKGIQLLGAKVLMLGLTFKEDCPDIRNTKAVDIYHALSAYSMDVDVYEPWADSHEISEEYDINCLSDAPAHSAYDAIIVSVGHSQFIELGAEGIKKYGKDPMVLFDVKGIFPLGSADGRL